MRNARRAFTQIELLITVLIMATLSALSIDLMRPSAEERVQAAVRLFVRDVEWARSATLTNPDDPAAIRLAADGSGWLVSRNATPTTPMSAADGSAMQRTLGVGMSEAAAGVRIASSDAAKTVIEFEPFGGVRLSPDSVRLYLQDSKISCLITFESGTGNIQTTWPKP